MKFILFFSLSISLTLLYSCNNGPKVIEVPKEEPSPSGTPGGQTGIFSTGGNVQESASLPPAGANVHTAVAKEVLPTERYVYIRVDEDGDEYWIATTRQEVEVGKSYFFKDGLLKTNFESKEYNRIFDRIFLVSSIVPADHGNSGGQMAGNQTAPAQVATDVKMPIRVEGSLPIGDLVADPQKYKGKEVQISGLVTKINPNIMGRNWIHLRDGTGEDYDLVLTSSMILPEGAVVTMRGTVGLDLDFGAGYRYDILIENATMVK